MPSAAALSLALASVTTVVAAPALAHISLDVPKTRYWQTSMMQGDQNKLKTSPCGAGADARTKDASLITTYQPGQKLTVKFRETVQHPGHFEISFDNDGQDFPFPGEAPSASSGVTVLVNNIPDKTSNDYSVEVTLPNVECEKCTLQLVQVMTSKMPPYSKSGDLYFECADLILKAGGGAGTGGASAGGGGGVATTSGGMGGAPNGSGGVTPGGSAGGGGATTGGIFATTGGSSSSTGGSSSSTGGTFAATGGSLSSTGGTLSGGTATGGSVSSPTGGLATGGSSSSTGGASGPSARSDNGGVGDEAGCSLTRSPRSGALFSVFALSALLGWQRRRRGTARTLKT